MANIRAATDSRRISSHRGDALDCQSDRNLALGWHA
jgi:hypothetical protein